MVFLAGGRLLGLAYIWLIVHWYGAAVYGRWALALTALSIAGVLANLGAHTAIVRFVAAARAHGDHGRLRDAYGRCLALVAFGGVALGVALFSLSDYLALVVFEKPGLAGLLRIAAFGVLPLAVVMLNTGALRGLRKATAQGFVEQTGTPLFAVVLLAAGYPAFRHGDMFALAYVGSLWLLAAGSSAIWIRLSGFLQPRPATGGLGYRELLDVSLPMLITDSMHLLKSWTDIVMVGLLCSDLDLAVYSLVLSVSALIVMPLMAVNSIAAPKFAGFHAADDIDGMARVARQSTRLIFWLVAPVLLVLVLFGGPLLGLFGDDLTRGAMALAIVALGRFFSSISGSVAPILNMTGHHVKLRNIVMLTSAVNLLMNLLLIPPYGIEGAAIATALTVVLSNVLCLRQIKRAFNFVPIYLPALLRQRS